VLEVAGDEDRNALDANGRELFGALASLLCKEYKKY
jgi:hypothetical protein